MYIMLFYNEIDIKRRTLWNGWNEFWKNWKEAGI